MKLRVIFSFLLTLLFLPVVFAQTTCSIPPNKVVPDEYQLAYQQMETVGFIHFTINTFYNREWGLGDEDPVRFNPYLLDVEQWVKTAKNAGIKELILTAKHHDGFCLWPSKFTEHSVKNSSYKNGKGDIVREFTNACHKYGIKAGLYLSPWDRNHKDYGRPAYITYYENQLTELLTHYGKINEIWFDGANGGDGYYGGAREKRIIDKNYYPFAQFDSIVKTLQPGCMIFSDAGPDIRWVGNENGYCGETFWSTIDDSKLVIGNSDTKYLNTGDPDGNKWILGQCDVSIRPGWFYHAGENDKVKSAAELTKIYYNSVGRNGVLLINIPPDSLGRLNLADSTNLVQFKTILNETFRLNLATQGKVTASSSFSTGKYYSPSNITDGKNESFWAAGKNTNSAIIEIQLTKAATFDRIMIQEPIKLGQRVSEFEISALVHGEWKTLSKGTTIGYKRLLKCDKVSTSKLRLSILNANNSPAISNFGLFLASEREH